MFEKTIVNLLKSMSAVIYVFIMLTLFSVPVIFIYQAVKPPVFTFEEVSVEEVSANDEYLKSLDKSTNGWIKLNYEMTASSGKFSPYSYKIEEFTVTENDFTETFDEIIVTLDEPLSFSNTETDSFTLSLYIKSDNKTDISSIAEKIEFQAVNYEKSFSEFSLKHGK